MPTESAKYCYGVDTSDKIVWVDDMWLAFARENGAADLTVDTILDRPIWDFVKGSRVCKLFKRIHDRVRSHVQSVTIPIRCDSPTLQRHMRLTIARDTKERLRYEVTLVRSIPTSYHAVLNPTEPRSDSLLTMCSICKKVLLEPVGWLDLEDAAVRLGLFETTEPPKLRQCICFDCTALMENAANGNAA